MILCKSAKSFESFVNSEEYQTICYGLLIKYIHHEWAYELAHFEMISTMVHQLTRNMTVEQLKGTPFEAYYVDHTAGIWPQAAGGIPFNACEFQSKGDAITDLTEDMAAEQKARSTYENLIRLTDDPDVLDPLRFLREREIVHFQRFGEALSMIQDSLNSKNFYAFNPEFDKGCK